jgi:hypothetical protein
VGISDAVGLLLSELRLWHRIGVLGRENLKLYVGVTNSEKLLLLGFDLAIEPSFFLKLHLLVQIHDCLASRLRLYPGGLAVTPAPGPRRTLAASLCSV